MISPHLNVSQLQFIIIMWSIAEMKKPRHALFQKTVFICEHAIDYEQAYGVITYSQHWPNVQTYVVIGIFTWIGRKKLKKNILLIILTNSRFLVHVAITFIVNNLRSQSAVDTG